MTTKLYMRIMMALCLLVSMSLLVQTTLPAMLSDIEEEQEEQQIFAFDEDVLNEGEVVQSTETEWKARARTVMTFNSKSGDNFDQDDVFTADSEPYYVRALLAGIMTQLEFTVFIAKRVGFSGSHDVLIPGMEGCNNELISRRPEDRHNVSESIRPRGHYQVSALLKNVPLFLSLLNACTLCRTIVHGDGSAIIQTNIATRVLIETYLIHMQLCGKSNLLEREERKFAYACAKTYFAAYKDKGLYIEPIGQVPLYEKAMAAFNEVLSVHDLVYLYRIVGKLCLYNLQTIQPFLNGSTPKQERLFEEYCKYMQEARGFEYMCHPDQWTPRFNSIQRLLLQHLVPVEILVGNDLSAQDKGRLAEEDWEKMKKMNEKKKKNNVSMVMRLYNGVYDLFQKALIDKYIPSA